jgi:hypothetical protein
MNANADGVFRIAKDISKIMSAVVGVRPQAGNARSLVHFEGRTVTVKFARGLRPRSLV